jgi:hypothetical protein
MSDSTSLHSIDQVQRRTVQKVKSQDLSQLIPETYTTLRARVLIVKSKEKSDELGKRSYIFGIMEDQRSRTPFICYKPYSNFFRDGVFEFKDVYVHKFEDNSVLLVVTERSSINYLINEDPKKYVWNQRIGDIKRPMGSCRVTLQGVLSRIASSSGLVQRCETCGRVAYEGKCPNGHEGKLFWAVRISGKLSDLTGSINVVFPQQLACKLVGRTIGEVLQLTEGQALYQPEFATESYTLNTSSPIEIYEAYADAPDDYRSAHSPVLVDLNDSRIIYPNDLQPRETFGNERRTLDLSKAEDRRDLSRLAERLLEIKLRKLTQLPKVNDILLTDQPVNLYNTENAKLYTGFRTKINVTGSNELIVQVQPSSEVYESLLDYVRFRRQRGASSTAIRNLILNYRRNVIFAPGGELATIINLKFMKAGEFKVPLCDLTLPEFWKKIHDVNVDPNETPLAVTKSYRLDLELTFPPSCIFFDKQSLRITYGARNFVDKKRREAVIQAKRLMTEALRDFAIGTFKLTQAADPVKGMDAREVLLADIRERLLGRSVKASGSVIEAGKELYFIPRTVEHVQ